MQKFKILTLSVLFFLPSTIFGIVGFGLNIIQDGAKLGGAVNVEGSGLASATVESFEMEASPAGGGGYFFIDLAGWAVELEANVVGGEYEFQFKNAFSEMPRVPFLWGRGSTAITIKKNVADFSIPLLAKTALSVGIGTNTHSSTPRASVSMVMELLDIDDPADLINAEFTPDALQDQIITYLEDNLIETSGIHAQLGLRFKVLVADVHVNFRYNIAEDVYKGQDSFTEIQVKAGFGF
tara:strand:+ start:381 stop:1094 length:714 start_codon:yes stop_codon:yes gene_type:complete